MCSLIGGTESICNPALKHLAGVLCVIVTYRHACRPMQLCTLITTYTHSAVLLDSCKHHHVVAASEIAVHLDMHSLTCRSSIDMPVVRIWHSSKHAMLGYSLFGSRDFTCADAKHCESACALLLQPCGDYYLAEKYHQQYLAKGGRFGAPQSAAKGCTDKIRCYG